METSLHGTLPSSQPMDNLIRCMSSTQRNVRETRKEKRGKKLLKMVQVYISLTETTKKVKRKGFPILGLKV